VLLKQPGQLAMAGDLSTISDRGTAATQLANLFEGYREEVVASWVAALYAMAGSHYREQPVTELQASTRNCIAALVALLRTEDYGPLSRYSEEICRRRAEQGFDISEVIEGHLLLKDVMLTVIQRECQWDSQEELAINMLALLDSALRWLVIGLSKHYSLSLNARLQEQVELLKLQREQLERRVREVSALMRSSTLITSTLELDRVLELILEQLAEVVEYDRASIQLLFDGKLRIIAGRGFTDLGRVLGQSFDPRQNPLTRRILQGKEPVVLGDVYEEPGFVADPDDPTHSWIGVPLIVRDEVIGALALDKHEVGFYDAEDGQTVLAFANQAAIAIENARLYDSAREQEILKERNRLARELHDSLSQALFSMVLNAEAAGLFFDTDPERARAQIRLLHETASAALKEMRSLIFELRPANLEQEGLATVLVKHARMVSERSGINVRADVKGQRRLPLHIEKALFRVAQEALNNVVKHSRATEALVVLKTHENMVYLTIEDNGVGIQPGPVRANTLGLTSMRERVEQLGGTIEITSGTNGTGTAVRVMVPCE
jgi:signal transduction histidine kinase